MARSRRWRPHGLGLGKGSKRQLPALARWRITTTILSVGLLPAQLLQRAKNPPGEQLSHLGFARGPQSFTSNRAIAKVCTFNDPRTAQQRSAPPAQPPQAPAAQAQLPFQLRAGLPGSEAPPAHKGDAVAALGLPPDSGVATTIRDPLLRQGGEAASKKVARDTGSTPVVGSIEQQSWGLSIRAQQRASFCFMPRRAGWPDVAKGLQTQASEQGAAPLRQSSVGHQPQAGHIGARFLLNTEVGYLGRTAGSGSQSAPRASWGGPAAAPAPGHHWARFTQRGM